ncbi:MAG: Fpg/Nei family DNA glycosylase [Pseudonocardiaceae bacterium]
MPEGHTTHRLAGAHQRHYAGSSVAVSSPQGRFAAAAARLDGRVLQCAEAHGKHLFHVYSPDLVVHVHLGLYGSVTDATLPVQPPQGQVRMRLVGLTHWTDLRGPMACELLTENEVDAVLARLGPDPLRHDADPDRVWARISRSRAPLATLLMDQAVISGVGNVYRAELLFRHRLDPQVPGCELRVDQWAALWSDLVKLMHDGVRRGRIDTVRPEHDPVRMGRAPRQDRHGGEVYVYRRAGAPCLVCCTAILTATHVGRTLYWCPRCQQRPAF